MVAVLQGVSNDNSKLGYPIFSELKNEVKSLNEKVETMDRSLDRHEQYSRRNCLLIHGVKENEKEDTDEVVIEFFEKEMKEKLSANDIDRSHRLG